jgi:hypothetical protein
MPLKFNKLPVDKLMVMFFYLLYSMPLNPAAATGRYNPANYGFSYYAVKRGTE